MDRVFVQNELLCPSAPSKRGRRLTHKKTRSMTSLLDFGIPDLSVVLELFGGLLPPGGLYSKMCSGGPLGDILGPRGPPGAPQRGLLPFPIDSVCDIDLIEVV